MNLANDCYAATDLFPDAERYGPISQIRRASTSIASNIAEGCGRDTPKKFARFLRIAYGSGCEIETQILVARRLSYGDALAIERLSSEVQQLRSVLYSIIRLIEADG